MTVFELVTINAIFQKYENMILEQYTALQNVVNARLRDFDAADYIQLVELDVQLQLLYAVWRDVILISHDFYGDGD